MDAAERELWMQFSAAKGSERLRLRDCLPARFDPLVLKVTRKVKASLPANIQFQDVAQDGRIGMLRAIERFDLSRKKTFGAFSFRHIYGAIIDAMRLLDEVPRLARKRGLCPVTFQMGERSVRGGLIDGENPCHDMQNWADPRVARPGARISSDDDIARLLAPLQKRTREFVTMYFIDGLTMKEIGKRFDVGEATVSNAIGHGVRVLRGTAGLALPSRRADYGRTRPIRVNRNKRVLRLAEAA